MDPLASIRGSKARSAAVAVVLLVVSILVCSSFLSVSKGASAGIIKVVRGYVLDQFANPIGGANVTVKAIRLGVTVDTLWYDLSEADGFYTVTFGFTNNLQAGDTIEVTASYSGHQGTNSVVADGTPQQIIDVTISGVSVPEFGPLSVAMICGAFVAVFILIGRRRTGS